MNEINNKLDGLNELITRIDAKVLEINTKLDELIKALHEYDDDQLDWPEPNDALKEAAFQYNETVLNERMDIIGQNGNNGDHYETLLSKMTQNNQDMGLYDVDEFDDYGKRNSGKRNSGKRVGKDKNKSNNSANTNVGKKKRDKWVSPYPPNPKRKSAIEEHIKYPPHKH
jgi:hypothetical protein